MARSTRGTGRHESTPATGAIAPTQRIDLFLWYARLAGSRSAAQALAGRAVVRLNGRRVERAHAPVRPGDIITMPRGTDVLIIRIVQLPTRRGPAAEARLAYDLIQPGVEPEGEVPRSIDIDVGPHGE